MTATCPQCGSNSIRSSHRRLRNDGLWRLAVYSPMRCQDCGHRYFRFSLWGVAGAMAVVLVIGFSASVVYTVSTYYAETTATPFTSQR